MVSEQLGKILADPLFAKSQRLAAFLRFIVEAMLDGQATAVKEYTIGVRVFQRSDTYNPQEDPIVRIMAGRLRAKLAEYYLGNGAHDPVSIELPRGGYVPRFSERRPGAPARMETARQRTETVGRKAERTQLWDALSASAVDGRMVTVSGDAGMGKTTFVEEFLAEATDGGIRLAARGRCSERLAASDAFAPILDALDGLLRGGGRPADLLESTAPAWHSQLAGISPGKPPSHERMRREFVAYLQQLAQARPVILFLDDLHWADASTCDLLTYLCQRLRGMPILIAATFRPGVVLSPGNPFLPLKLRLERWGVGEEIPLSFLTRDEVAQHLANRFPGHCFPAELAGIVHERTEGQPLFLADLLRYLVDTRMLSRGADGGAWRLSQSLADVRRAIPPGTHAMIGMKLASLAEADRNILLCGAVQGVQFDTAVVAEVLSLDAALVEERLREMEAVHRLVFAVGEQDGAGLPLSVRYRFAHVYYQNALYASLTPSRRAASSLAVAGVLTGLAGEAAQGLAAELAVLYEYGRDYASASRHFLQAARNAARVFAYPEAALLCERGLQSLGTQPESRQRDEQELLYSLTLGMALMSTRGYAAPEVERTYRRARELCLALNETRRLVPALWAIHTCLTNSGRLGEALAVAREMEQAAAALQHRDSLIEALHATGTTLAFMGRLTEARQALERIFEIAPVSQHEFRGTLYVLDPLVTSLSMLGRLLTLIGESESSMRTAREAVELAGRLTHPHSLAYAQFWIGWILHARGEHAEACAPLEAAMEMARAHDLPLFVEWGRVVRGSALALSGRQAEGIAEIRKSLERQDAMGSKLERPYCLTLLAEALLANGEAAEARLVCERALTLAESTGALDFQPETHRVHAHALSALGDVERAEAEIAAGLALARRAGCRLLEGRLERSAAQPEELRQVSCM